jgi:hypothetical protein
MRIGMPIAEARQVSGQAFDSAALDEETPGACNEQEYTLANGEKLWLMFEGDVITRITASAEAPQAHARRKTSALARPTQKSAPRIKTSSRKARTTIRRQRTIF